MILDTNILIAYSNEEKKVVESINTWFANHIALFVSAVSYTEVLALPEATASDVTKMRQFLNNFIFVDVNKTIAETSAEVKRKYKLKFPDAAIVATAKHLDVSLVTRDKQIRRVKEISIITV